MKPGSQTFVSKIENESLSIIFGAKLFHKNLYGHKFTLTTDQKPLASILGPEKMVPTLRMQCWS